MSIDENAPLLNKLRRPLAFYPVTLVYGAGVLVAIGVARLWFELGIGLIALTSFAIVVVLVSMLKELRTVHEIVVEQTDELNHLQLLVSEDQEDQAQG